MDQMLLELQRKLWAGEDLEVGYPAELLYAGWSGAEAAGAIRQLWGLLSLKN